MIWVLELESHSKPLERISAVLGDRSAGAEWSGASPSAAPAGRKRPCLIWGAPVFDD